MWFISRSRVSVRKEDSDSMLVFWCRRSANVNLVLFEKVQKGEGGGEVL